MCSVQSSSDRVKGRHRAIPAQLIYVVEERDVSPKCGKCSEKYCAIPFAAKGVGEGTRVGCVHAPFATVGWDGFNMEELGQDGSRGLRTPAWQPRIAICRIAHQRQIVWDRCRRNAKLLDDRRFVKGDPRPAIQLDDTCAAHTLGKVFVWRADNHAFHTRVAGRAR